MSLRSRRILFAFFVLLFIILVPIVLLYATGHTINWRRLSLEKSASVLIESNPSGATIFLNGQIVHKNSFGIIDNESQETTPARIKDLAPGDYVVRIEKYGYWPWEERLRLSPGEALNLGIIHLFSQAKPELVLESSNIISKTSPDGSAIAVISGTKLSIINTETDKQSDFTLPAPPTQKDIIWSGDSQRLVVDSWIIDRNKKAIDTIQTKGSLKQFHWDRRNSSLLYFLSEDKLMMREIENGKERPVAIPSKLKNQSIIDFDIYDKQAHIIVKDKANNTTLLIGPLDREMNTMTLTASSYKFIESNFDRPLLAAGRSLYVIDKPLPLVVEPRLLEITNHYTTGRSIDSSFVYATPLELRRWDNENQEYILTRFGSAITLVWPLKKNPATLIALSDGLRLYVSGRSPLTLTLANISDVSEIALSIDERTIYFVGNYQDTKGLFRLTLNEK